MSVENIRFLPACCLCSRNIVNYAASATHTAHSRSQSVAPSDLLVIRAILCERHIYARCEGLLPVSRISMCRLQIWANPTCGEENVIFAMEGDAYLADARRVQS